MELETAKQTLAADGLQLHPPRLALGTFERVGSNWFLSQQVVDGPTYNEPFRHQLHPSHPLSTMHTSVISLEDYLDEMRSRIPGTWLRSFVLGKYNIVRATVKETSLFFALASLVQLFPDADLLILSRSPEGILSSFRRRNLFEHWDYRGRLILLREQAESNTWTQPYGSLLACDPADEIRCMARLLVLNTLLIAEAVKNRAFETRSYEAEVGRQAGADSSDKRRSDELGRDATFSTRSGDRVEELFITPSTGERFREAIATALADSEDFVASSQLVHAKTLLAPAGNTKYLASDTPTGGKRATPQTDIELQGGVGWEAHDDLVWRRHLVSNRDLCQFLNVLHRYQVFNVQDGVQVFANEAMPPARGGRILRDEGESPYTPLPGYEHHPAYWVTWIGAALISRYLGGRLPLRSELARLANSAGERYLIANADFAVGDVTSVSGEGLHLGGVKHAVGNLYNWCSDGPQVRDAFPPQRFYFGTAWGKPATRREVWRVRARTIFSTSRSIGVRVVRDGTSASAQARKSAVLIAQELEAKSEADIACMLSGTLE